MSFGGNKKCQVCGKAVYHAERAEGNEEFHKRCFKCGNCNKLLDSTTAAMHEGMPFCRSCHNKNFGSAGYGYGGGAAGPMGRTNAPAPLQPQIGGAVFEGKPLDCAQDECPRCGKKVYAAERKLAAGREYHKSCFRCMKCSKGLDSNTLTAHDGGIYCKACYGKNFGQKGYGFGQGSGTFAYTE